ncbi:MAG: hypothetical protein ACREBM_01900, partial [Sphingomicrobium sp.]
FASSLDLRKDGRFTLDYRGQMVLQLPPDESRTGPWKDSMARCREDGPPERVMATGTPPSAEDMVRPCTAAEIAELKSLYDADMVEKRVTKGKEAEEVAKAFGLPGRDDESNRAFAAKLMKYAGWRSVTYRGEGVFDVDYHFEGRATQDFLFPALPDNDMIVPFIAIRRRTDGSVLVTAPAMTGGSGPMAVRAGVPTAPAGQGPVSRAEGRLTIVTNGEILTNNSEDGPQAHAGGRQLNWNVSPASTKIPEMLIRLQ